MKLRTLRSGLQTVPGKLQSLPTVGSDRARERRKVYDSRRWREHVRPNKLLLDPTCQRCKLLGIVTLAAHVDHHVPIGQCADPFDEGNLVSLCSPCHTEKSHCDQRGEQAPAVAPSTERSIGV